MFGKKEPYDPVILKKMRSEWNKRAQDNARHYVATGQTNWSDKDFFSSGQTEIDDIVLKDIDSISAGRKASEMRILEIGCGAGRVTEPLSRIFGKVDAVDISSEMIAQALASLSDRTNIEFHVNNGFDLSIFPGDTFDFALSMIVFQHIPRKAIVENYIRETARVLRPHSLFKFQLQGFPISEEAADTWVGAGFTESEVADCASRCGFEVRDSRNAGTQYYWVTLRKP